MERKLSAEVAAGRSPASLKSVNLQQYGIPARMFNGMRVPPEGRMSSVRETMALRQDTLQRQIARAGREIAKAGRRGRWAQVHQKRLRLANLKSTLVGVQADSVACRVPLCLGSKRLWRKQHQPEQNGYASHAEWLRDRRDARSGEFLVLGSRDETADCQLCVAGVAGCL